MLLPQDWSKVSESLIILILGGGITFCAKWALKTVKDLNNAFFKIRQLEREVNELKRDVEAMGIEDAVGLCDRSDCPVLPASSGNDYR